MPPSGPVWDLATVGSETVAFELQDNILHLGTLVQLHRGDTLTVTRPQA